MGMGMFWLLAIGVACAADPMKKGGATAFPGIQKELKHKPAGTGQELSTAPGLADTVQVFKPDGSLQCGMGRAVPLEEMAGELKNLKIYKSEKRMDGRLRIMQCGTPTGMCNVYRIDRSSLEKAREYGFMEWTFENSP